MKTVIGTVMIVALACAIWAQAPAQPPTGQAAPKAAPKLAPGATSAGFDGSAYTKARDIPARIVNFSAEPASIRPGQSFTLIWHAENPSGVTIDPEPGRVMPRGSRLIQPAATTTYTLTVRGANNQLLTRSVTVNVAGATPVAAAPADAKKAVPRTADGKADLSGVYGGGGGGGGGRGAAGGAAPAGPVLKAGAEKFRIVRGPEDTGATANCMPLIPPQSWGVPYQFQILQGANYVAIFHEYPGAFRIIPTDGTPHQVDPDPSWLGDSVGHWEGDTLVVDTIGFNDKTDLQGFRHTESLHMVEKFRRTAFETVQYEATIEDPNVFEKPWTIARNFALRPDLKRIDEFICENNRDYRPLYGTK
ncbi:MAG: hypothetical protein HYU27_06385 [Acidobacteria bacterium]|nr:hypothetical protein [Acidobacteriota bacterium]